ncbi:hypothetical protein [Nonomuraea mesophila]|uniref:hypothetical protein n=1 Tax=Nonomuraea mesophila TaxID=2530382 RepID=UPI00140B8DD2
MTLIVVDSPAPFGARKPIARLRMTLIVADSPAPFGPRRPATRPAGSVTRPGRTSKVRSPTAGASP